MPDHDYLLAAWANGYVPKTVRHLNLPEGASAEVELVMRKRPAPPAVGAPAPPFRVATLDGQTRTLPDYRGRYLLLHFWGPFHAEDRDLGRLDAIRRRYGADRLEVLGLCLAADPGDARRALAGTQVRWPQVVLLDQGADPILLDYGINSMPNSVLVGPDGTILGRDLLGDPVDAALRGAMGAR